MPTYTSSVTRTLNTKLGEHPSVLDYGVTGLGVVDETAKMVLAVNSVSSAGGGVLIAPKGNYLISGNGVAIPSNVTLIGQGKSTRFFRGGTLNAGFGVFNFSGSDSGLSSCLIDGMVTTSSQLHYGDFSSNPDHALLNVNSSAWIHSGAAHTNLSNITFLHTGGYAVKIDADTADVTDTVLNYLLLFNCRPHTFALDATSVYGGSWTGGIYISGDCSARLFAARGVTISNIRANRCTGNVIWMHSNGFATQHTNVTISDVNAEDIGRDVIELGNLFGGSVTNVTGHRIGYITGAAGSDTDTPAPVFINTVQSAAFDCTGFARGITVSNVSFTSVNGEGFDLDGMRDSTIANISCVIPAAADPEYSEDSIASYGFGGSGNITRGIQTGNTSLNGGAKNISIVGGLFVNMGQAAVVLANAKGCHVTRLRVVHTSTVEGPMLFNGTNSAVDETSCYNNTIEDNSIDYNQNQFCIYEVGSFKTADVNFCFGNRITGANKGEFLKLVGSSSQTSLPFSTNDPTVNAVSQNILQREGYAATAAWKGYKSVAGVNTQIWQVSDTGPVWNVSMAGAANTGAFTTGAVVSLGFYDCVITKRLMSEGGFLSLHDVGPGTFDTAGDTLEAASQAPAAYGLIRYNKTSGLQQSVATDGTAHRIWTALGSGAVSVAGIDKQIQFNSGGAAFGASASLTWDNAALTHQITGFSVIIAGTPSSAVPVCITRGGTSQVGNLQEWRNVSGAALLAIDPHGTVFYRNDNLAPYPTGATGTGAIWYDVTTNKLRASENGGTAVNVINSASVPGATTQVIYNLAGVLAAANNFTFDGASCYADGFGIINNGAYYAKDNVGGGTYRRVLSMGTDNNLYLDNQLNTNDIYIRPSPGRNVIFGMAGQAATLYPNSAFVDLGKVASPFQNMWASAINLSSTSTQALNVPNGHVSALGYTATDTANNTIQAVNGGVTASTIVPTSRIAFTGLALPAVGTSTQMILGSDGAHLWISEGGAAFTRLTGAVAVGGTNQQVQFNNGGGGFGASADLTWNGATLFAKTVSVQNANAYFAKDFGGSSRGILQLYSDNVVYLDNPVGHIYLRPLAGSNVVVQAPFYPNSVTVAGSAGTAALAIAAGYAQSSEGFYTLGTQSTSFNAPNGGLFVGLGVATNYGLLPKALSTTPVFVPAGGYGALAYKAGSQFWYYNAGWQIVDFAASGGGVTSIIAGANIQISGATGAVNVAVVNNPSFQTALVTGINGAFVLSNGWVDAAQGFYTTTVSQQAVNVPYGGCMAREFNLSNGAGGYYTFVDPSRNADFITVKIAGNQVINNLGHFVGFGVDCGANGISGGGYNLSGGFFGQTVFKTVSDGSGGTFTLQFRGGILTSFT